MDGRQYSNAIAAGGGVFLVLGGALALLPTAYNGIGCGSVLSPIVFGSPLVQTSVTRGCAQAVSTMWAASVVLAAIGLAVVVAALVMRMAKAVA